MTALQVEELGVSMMCRVVCWEETEEMIQRGRMVSIREEGDEEDA